jgi:AraC-like DNA-binding protein
LLLLALVHSAKKSGLTPNAFRRGVGLSLNSLVQAPRIETALARSAAQRLSALSGDRALGLHAIEEAAVGSFGLLEELVLNSKTWGAGLARLAQHFSLVDDSASIWIVDEGKKVRVLCQASDMVPVAEDMLLASLVLRARHYCGPQIHPLYVRSVFPRPEKLHEHERILRVPLYFDAPFTEVAFDKETLRMRHPGAIPGVSCLVEQFLSRSGRTGIVLDQTHAPRRSALTFREGVLAVRFCIEQGTVQLKDVAAVLGTSPRSLQRYLRQAGTTLSSLVESERSVFLATHAGRLSKSSVAGYLGYSDRRSLRRAQAQRHLRLKAELRD